MQVDGRRRLGLHDDVIGAALGKSLDVMFRLDDHQMHVERLGGGSADRLDDRGAERDIGDEASVHHIDMDPIRPGLIDRPYFLGKPTEIRRQYGRSNEKVGHSYHTAEGNWSSTGRFRPLSRSLRHCSYP